MRVGLLGRPAKLNFAASWATLAFRPYGHAEWYPIRHILNSSPREELRFPLASVFLEKIRRIDYLKSCLNYATHPLECCVYISRKIQLSSLSRNVPPFSNQMEENLSMSRKFRLPYLSQKVISFSGQNRESCNLTRRDISPPYRIIMSRTRATLSLTILGEREPL